MIKHLLICAMIIGIANAFEHTVIKAPSGSSYITARGIGSNIAIIDSSQTYIDGGFLLYVYEKDDVTGKWENTTVTIDKTMFSGAGHTVDFHYIIHITTDDIVVGHLRDNGSGDGKVYRMSWDSVNKQFNTPVYSSLYVSINEVDSISSDGSKLVIVDSGTSTTISTYYWSGVDYIQAPDVTVNSNTNGAAVQVFNDKLLIGEPRYTASVPLNTGGHAYYKRWDDVNKQWGATEGSFPPPTSRSSSENGIYKCGTNAWMSDYSAIVYCPDGYNQNAGAYYRYRHDGTNWVPFGSYRFPDQYAYNDRLGRIYSQSDYFMLVEDGKINDYYIYSDQDTYWYMTNFNDVKAMSEIPFVSQSSINVNVYNKVAFKSFSASTDIYITLYNFEPTGFETLLPSITRIINPASPTNNQQLGKNVDIAGDYAAICSVITLEGSTTSGAVYIYKRNTNTGEWEEQDKIGPGSVNGQSNIQFCQSDLSFDGSTIVVSAPYLNGNTESGSGGIFIYDWDGTTITYNSMKTPDNEYQYSNYGSSISVSGNVIVVGHTGCDNIASNVGCAYVYEKVGGSWSSGTLLDYPAGIDASDAYGRSVATDGETIAVTSNVYGTSNPKGIVCIYTFNGTAWNLDQELFPQTGTVGFGSGLALDDSWLFATAQEGNIHAFKKSGSTWSFYEMISRSSGSDINDDYGMYYQISYSHPILSVSSDDDWFAYNGRSSVSMFLFNGTTWMNDDEEYYMFGMPDGQTFSSTAEKISTDGSSIIVSQHSYNNNSGTIDNSGRVFVLPIFQPCIQTSDCPSEQYCGVEEFCVNQKACTTHADCIGEFVTGRLAYCDSTLAVCHDKYEGTCSSLNECNFKHSKIKANANKLGSVSQTVYLSNVTKAREAVFRMYTELYDTTSVTQTLDTFIDGTDEVTINSDLFTNYGDDTALLDHIKSIVCPAEVVDLCSIGTTSRRRLRELQSEITVEVTYSLDSTLFESLVANGTTFSDGSEFEQALADALGVNTSDIVLTAASGTLSVEYVVSQEATGDDPLSEENIAALQDVENDLTTITNTIITDLNINVNSINTQEVDYCNGRDCNGRGTCDPNTGICNCTDTDYWGINCETLVSCNNGTKATGRAYCFCDYPEYGQRCENTKDCDVCF